MCGRFSLAPTTHQVKNSCIKLDLPEDFIALFNIAPAMNSIVILPNMECVRMSWGLIPAWEQKERTTGKFINARIETISEKAVFKNPLIRQRCIVPADSFYEWKKCPGSTLQPYRIFRHDGVLLYFAAIWEVNEYLAKTTFSILTTQPNADMSNLHNRMPVILQDEEMCLDWLNSESQDLTRFMFVRDNFLINYPVTPSINKVGTEGPHLHVAIPEQPSLFD